MTNELTQKEYRMINEFECGRLAKQLGDGSLSIYKQLNDVSKRIFINSITQGLTKIAGEDWRGEAGKQEERDWLLKEHAQASLRGILKQQLLSEEWKGRIAEERAKGEGQRR